MESRPTSTSSSSGRQDHFRRFASGWFERLQAAINKLSQGGLELSVSFHGAGLPLERVEELVAAGSPKGLRYG
jgi:hypothetical protein